MDIGIPKERRESEYRVGLTPIGVQLLTADGHACYVERGAGLGAGFSDRDYEQAGARIVYQPHEVFWPGRSGVEGGAAHRRRMRVVERRPDADGPAALGSGAPVARGSVAGESA